MSYRLVTSALLLLATPAAPEVRSLGRPHYQPMQLAPPSRLTLTAGAAPKCVDANRQPIPCAVNMQYYGGHVLSNVKVYAVFWSTSVTSDVQSGVPTFYSALVNSDYLDWLTEYSTNLTAEAGTHAGQAGSEQVIGRGTFAGSYTLTNFSKSFPACPAPDGTLLCLSDADIANELDWQVSQSHLPVPDANTLYVVHFPATIRVSDPGQVSCKNFCAYHGTYQNAAKQSVFYAVMPELGANGCETGCGGGSTFQNTCAVASHEIAECITDGEAGLANIPDFPQAWFDSGSPSQGEIGDMCKGNVDTVGTDGLTGCAAGSAGCYSVQPVFSRAVWNADPASQPNVPACVASRYEANDYSIALARSTLGLGPGATSQPIAILTAASNGAPGAVTLSVTDLPAGVHASIDVASLSVGGTANLTVSAEPSAPPLKDGVLVVRATGATTHSAALLVQVDTLPTVSISSPAAGATVTGSTLVTVAAVPGTNTSIASIAIAIDGNSPLSSSTASSAGWDTRAVSNGRHAINVTVVDADGGRATTSLSVTVANASLGNVIGGCSSTGAGNASLALLVVAAVGLPLGRRALRRRLETVRLCAGRDALLGGEEANQRGVEGLGVVSLHHVPGVGNGVVPGAGDAGRHPVGHGGEEWVRAGAGEDQHRSAQPAQLAAGKGRRRGGEPEGKNPRVVENFPLDGRR
jgi:hypothetical protein